MKASEAKAKTGAHRKGVVVQVDQLESGLDEPSSPAASEATLEDTDLSEALSLSPHNLQHLPPAPHSASNSLSLSPAARPGAAGPGSAASPALNAATASASAGSSGNATNLSNSNANTGLNKTNFKVHVRIPGMS